jgi:hypothetical protein
MILNFDKSSWRDLERLDSIDRLKYDKALSCSGYYDLVIAAFCIFTVVLRLSIAK